MRRLPVILKLTSAAALLLLPSAAAVDRDTSSARSPASRSSTANPYPAVPAFLARFLPDPQECEDYEEGLAEVDGDFADLPPEDEEAPAAFLQLGKRGGSRQLRRQQRSRFFRAKLKVKKGCPRRKKRASARAEVLVADQCRVSSADLLFLGLRKSAFTPAGVVLPETKAYVADCAECERHGLACAAKKVDVEDGQCVCLWRSGKEREGKMRRVPCLSCVAECIGRVQIFAGEKEYEPSYVGGVCVQKKSLDLPAL